MFCSKYEGKICLMMTYIFQDIKDGLYALKDVCCC